MIKMYPSIDFIIRIILVIEYVPEVSHVLHKKTLELSSTSSLRPSFQTVVTKTPNITSIHGVNGVQNITSIHDVIKGSSILVTHSATEARNIQTKDGVSFSEIVPSVQYETRTSDISASKTPTMFSTHGVTEGPSISATHTTTEVQYSTTVHNVNFLRNFNGIHYVTRTEDKTAGKTPTMFSTNGVTEVPNISALHSATEGQNTQTTHGSHFERNKHPVRVINKQDKTPNSAPNIFSTYGVTEGPGISATHTATGVQNTTTVHNVNFLRNFNKVHDVTRTENKSASGAPNMSITHGVAEAAKMPTYQMDRRTPPDTATALTTAIDPSIEAIKSDLCEEQPYFIHKLSNFTLSNKTSEKIWRQLVAKPLVKYICKKKKLKLFKRWIFMLGFDTDGDNKIKPDEINEMHDEIKTWKENRQKRKGKKDKKRKLRHQGHKNIS